MDIFTKIDIERVATIILFVCLILGVIFLVVSGIGMILHVSLVWAKIAFVVSFGLAAICAGINGIIDA